MTEADKPGSKTGKDKSSCPLCGKLTAKPLLISVVLIVVVLVAAIAFLSLYHPAVAKAGDNVSVYYSLQMEDGTIYESNFNSSPISFTVGSSQVIPGFSKTVEGMSVGQVRTVKIPAKDAYGEYNSSLIHTIEKSNFAQTNFTVGQTYYVVNHQTGAMSMVKILNVTNETVTWDANSPLAGKDLTFAIKLAAIGKP